jgi:hypothetical protein
MKIKKIMLLCLVAGFFGANLFAANAQNSRGSKTLLGSWTVRVTPDQPGPPPFDEMMTFAEGGGVVESNNLFPAAGASPGHGSWDFEGRKTFTFTFIKFLFDPNTNQPTGKIKVKGTIFNLSHNSWEGMASVEIFDPAGNVVLTGSTTAQSTRIIAGQ